ncbi:uncharacterized protein LOC131995143 isoform X2 [Stomoxys calcitrans]|uniref:uncharacterized protein LOC131995143 isoform X2 n=1 Tax=Stomoxys calcitrans TaxID=35570 RepID=UPI0027E23C19|nr:uncharacterized protein LOC131995143 isoform X2 [Stomoxys calcitrans]
MSSFKICCLCLAECSEYESLYQKGGKETRLYEMAYNIFHPYKLDVICLECWYHILDFEDFRMNIIKAQFGGQETNDVIYEKKLEDIYGICNEDNNDYNVSNNNNEQCLMEKRINVIKEANNPIDLENFQIGNIEDKHEKVPQLRWHNPTPKKDKIYPSIPLEPGCLAKKTIEFLQSLCDEMNEPQTPAETSSNKLARTSNNKPAISNKSKTKEKSSDQKGNNVFPDEHPEYEHIKNRCKEIRQLNDHLKAEGVLFLESLLLNSDDDDDGNSSMTPWPSNVSCKTHNDLEKIIIIDDDDEENDIVVDDIKEETDQDLEIISIYSNSEPFEGNDCASPKVLASGIYQVSQ